MPRSVPYLLRLPGRRRFVELCHAEPAGCPRCLEAVAAFLAEELGGDLQAALDRPTEAYRAELNGAEPGAGPEPGRCTPEQARDLRRRTVEACWWSALFRGAAEGPMEPVQLAPPVVADLDDAGDAVEATAR